MFFLTPGLLSIIVYVAAAVLPAAFLLRYIYRHDTIEKEPHNLLIRLLIGGVLAAFLAIVLETIGERVLSLTLNQESPIYTIVFAFLVVAAAEEGAKLFFLYRRTWNNPNFDYQFDGIVFAVFVSLGFAAFENIGYVFGYGLSVALPRAVLSIPGHMGFAVVMGYFYSRARLAANHDNKEMARRNMLTGYFSAVFLHGFYDACAMLGTTLSLLFFVAFVVACYIFIYRLIKRESRLDKPLW